MSYMRSKPLVSIAIILWTGAVLTVFFVVQKPVALTVASGLLSLASTIGFWLLFIIMGAGMGYGFRHFMPEMESTQRLYFFTGTGLGILGLIGFGLAAIGLAHSTILILLLALMGMLSFWNHSLYWIWSDLKKFITEFKDSAKLAPAWIKWFAIAATSLSFILALAPPIEAFDALLYHLTVPTWWLRDGGLRLVNMPHYWFPSLVEGMFVWPLAFHNDIVPQLIHFTFGILFIILVWDWVKTLWGPQASWWSIAIFLSMPSLTWLAAWAYTDLALIFFALASLYALWKWKSTSLNPWLTICGIMAGFAMGIKYTSVVLPIAIAGLIIWWGHKNLRKMASHLLRIAGTSLLIASPWYLRNWFWTGNPFYPFLFWGPYWDSFRAAWYAGSGTGIGWSPASLLSLPLVTTLGYRDANYFDGRFGPFYLILFPLVVLILWKFRKDQSDQREALVITSVFSLLSILSWVYGVIQTSHLWQARLLWPGLVPLALPMVAGILDIKKLDGPRLRLSFILSAIMGITIFTFLLDFGLMVLNRDPLAFAIGLESRQSYASRQQPEYAAALALVDQTPPDAYIYLINEPRSYGMNRRVQPDPINDNLPHDFYLYSTNDELISAWRKLGYTYILISEQAIKTDSPDTKNNILPGFYTRLDGLEKLLSAVGQTKTNSYTLYAIPKK